MGNKNWELVELRLALALLVRLNWKIPDKSNQEVVKLSNLLRKLETDKGAEISKTYRSPSSVALKLRNLASLRPEWSGATTHTGKGDKQILEEFNGNRSEFMKEAEAMFTLLESSGSDANQMISMLDIDFANEGSMYRRTVLLRERSRSLREAKIKQVVAQGKTICCQICGFDFELVYGDHGSGYIEVHHAIPLHETGPRDTYLKHLVLLCSNCHRMIHRKDWIKPEELQEIYDGNCRGK